MSASAAVPIGVASLAGLAAPSTYAAEAPAWAAQAVGQDVVNLLVVAPALLVAGWLADRGSARARLMIGGCLVYAAYSHVVYAVGLHFNRLFLCCPAWPPRAWRASVADRPACSRFRSCSRSRR